MHKGPEVRPTPAAFVPGEQRGIRPAEKHLKRSVVATRPPHSSSERGDWGKRKQEVSAPHGPGPRIVPAPQQSKNTEPLQRPPFGKSTIERRPKTTAANSPCLPGARICVAAPNRRRTPGCLPTAVRRWTLRARRVPNVQDVRIRWTAGLRRRRRQAPSNRPARPWGISARQRALNDQVAKIGWTGRLRRRRRRVPSSRPARHWWISARRRVLTVQVAEIGWTGRPRLPQCPRPSSRRGLRRAISVHRRSPSARGGWNRWTAGLRCLRRPKPWSGVVRLSGICRASRPAACLRIAWTERPRRSSNAAGSHRSGLKEAKIRQEAHAAAPPRPVKTRKASDRAIPLLLCPVLASPTSVMSPAGIMAAPGRRPPLSSVRRLPLPP